MKENSVMTKEKARELARALVGQMTVEEKASQLLYNSPAIERLGIHDYNWWNEASHGVARSGMATVFPHAIGLASTFNPDLIGEVGEAVSTEARAKYNNSVEYNDFDIYKGLTYWTPNINIFRDPRWGRGQETFGEDPFLIASLAVPYIKGLQGDGEFLKSAACAKHFAVHSGPEAGRHSFNSVTNAHDLWETYLPAFEWCVKEGGVAGVMGAYNRTNGQPCCGHSELIGDILLGQWNFDGYFVSDCGAIYDICKFHHYTDTMEEAAALALKAGCNLNCGDAYTHLMEAYEQDLITEDDLTEAAVKVYTIRYLLGEFEENRPYSDIPFDKLDCDEHRDLNLRAAEECMVLLKNDGFLPLDAEKAHKIAVIGPNAMSQVALEGNYNGMASEYITVADGVRRVFSNSSVRAAKGANIFVDNRNDCSGFTNMISEGIAYAKNADITVLVLGLDCHIEGEEIRVKNDYFEGGDRKRLQLPKTQMDLAEAVCEVCDNVIVVVLAGSAVDLGEKLTNHAHAVIHGWYPGAVGGLAAARLIAGKYSPSAKLPLTFYHSCDDLPAYENYDMTGRTYRYFTGDVLYPFGYGLSYTTFAYDNVTIAAETDDAYEISMTVANTGDRDGIEKVQIYASYTDSRTPTPLYQLCGVKAVDVKAGEAADVTVKVNKYWLKAVLEDGTRTEPDGKLELYVGGHQPDKKSAQLC
ncbi:MAG: glycoside hydrolase family 3 C-terminal domain-containing protein, partial [Clostridia bacterium]|nr:glycoside hydrolase family 3 C-terminal domain-containing protein [Clostridia bacterium]